MNQRYELLKARLIELIDLGTENFKEKVRLLNSVIALSNPQIRVYYNFSVMGYRTLLENTTFEEIDGILKELEPSKQYAFKTLEQLDDFLDFLLEDGSEQCKRLYNEINKKVIKINNNLFMYEER